MTIGEQCRQAADRINEARAKSLANTLHSKILKDCKDTAGKGDYEVALTSKNGYSALYNTEENQIYTLISTLDTLLKEDGIELVAPVDSDSSFYSPSNTNYRASFKRRNK